jgi:hypothetical protein
MLKKILLPVVMVMGINAYADEGNDKGLIGVEVGYVGAKYNERGSAGTETDESNTASIGLKLGAEGRHYRVFVEGRYWNDKGYDNALTIGGAFQYLIRPTETMNIFMGVNAGFINSTEKTKGEPYYGGDLGVNFDLQENLGLEVGVRYCDVDEGREDYAIGEFWQTYVSAIFKFSSDY